MLTEMYCSSQYLSINHSNAHKTLALQNTDISETIKDRELGFRFRFFSFVRSARLLREHVTPPLTPTSRPELWLLQFSRQIK